MKLKKISRREMLKGVFAGTSYFVGLPLLEAMGSSVAYAAQASSPYFLLYSFGNGVGNYASRGGVDNWTPSGSGSNWNLSPNMMPLAAHKDYLNVLSNMRVFLKNGGGHHECRAAVFSGQHYQKDYPDAYQKLGSDRASIDQYIGDALAAQGLVSPYHSLVLALSKVSYAYTTLSRGHSLSWKKNFKVQIPEYSPRALYERLFSGFTPPNPPPGGGTPSSNVKAELKALDAIFESAKALISKVGSSDKQRMNAHLEGLFETQRALENYEKASCTLPSKPSSDYEPNNQNVEALYEKNIVMSKLIAHALACDLTKSINYMFCGMQGNPVITETGAVDGFHKITHDGIADDGANRSGIAPEILINRITEFNMARFADLLTELRNTPHGSGNLLDQGCILLASEFMVGADHSANPGVPLLMAGKAAGRLKTNYHYRAPNTDSQQNAGRALLTALQVMGINENFIEGGLNQDSRDAITELMT
ncbi:MAG TPA: DUF1552 domain-containing protein [Oligoflexia bacterium]|nr:DUF1552 domain-containing protein [Oligoflexia bacterium]HMR24344.1 DUF1552 domain-containing protein [Oligoflexia bacterium]